ncbi:MAG: DNA polymerase III subunit epsilon [Gammaproteobacteria bacterium]
MRQIILDTETTGLQTEDGHRIIEIGAIEMINRKFTGKRYHQYINPERDSDEGALAVHGITKEFLQNKPVFAQVAQEFMDFIIDAELIIHNAPFDTGFINYELKLTKNGWKPLSKYCHVIDTLIMARQLHIGQRNSLDALCKRYSVDNSQRDLHGALLDAHLLAQVYLAMTGGQGSLFEENQATESAKQETITLNKMTLQSRNLIVLMASAEELASHEMKLQAMNEKGKCLWE